MDTERRGGDTTLRVLSLPCHKAVVVEMAVREMGLLVLLLLDEQNVLSEPGLVVCL